MKTNKSTPYNYNQKNILQARKNPNFKGYFACPLKEIHMHPGKDFRKLIPELHKKCGNLFDIIIQTPKNIFNLNQIKPENCRNIFDAIIQTTKSIFNLSQLSPKNVIHGLIPSWSQDYKVFLENNTIGSLYYPLEKNTLALSKKIKLPVHKISSDLPGGNFFIGKNHQGESILLVGEEELPYTKIKVLSKKFRVKPKNIFTIPQPDFHLDMNIRPLNYPYVLVGDEKMVFKELMDSKAGASANFRKIIYSMLLESEKYKLAEGYKSTEEIIHKLESQGFKTIRVPGVFGKHDFNLMNAVVHQKPNGDLVYITGKSNLFKKKGLDLNKNFEKALIKAAPQVKEVIFIDSKSLSKRGKTAIEDSIKINHGGLHCMCCERPDFEKWNKMIKAKAPR